MKILFFDASQDWIEVSTCSISDSFEHELHYRIAFKSVKESSFRLVKEIETALEKSSWEKPDLIVVCDGPGSFTGVRITITTARSLGQFWNIPLLPIHSVSLYSLSLFRTLGKSTLIALDGKQGKYFFGGLPFESFSSIQDLEPQNIMRILERADFSKTNFAVSGNALPFSQPELLILNENLPNFFEALQTDYFRSLLTKEQFSNYAEVLPFYLRGTYVD